MDSFKIFLSYYYTTTTTANDQSITTTEHDWILMGHSDSNINGFNSFDETLAHDINDVYTLNFSVPIKIQEHGQNIINPITSFLFVGSKIKLELSYDDIELIIKKITPIYSSHCTYYQIEAQDIVSLCWSKHFADYSFSTIKDNIHYPMTLYEIATQVLQDTINSYKIRESDKWKVIIGDNELQNLSFSLEQLNSNPYAVLITACDIVQACMTISFKNHSISFYRKNNAPLSGIRSLSINRSVYAPNIDAERLSTVLHVQGAQNAAGSYVSIMPEIPECFEDFYLTVVPNLQGEFSWKDVTYTLESEFPNLQDELESTDGYLLTNVCAKITIHYNNKNYTYNIFFPFDTLPFPKIQYSGNGETIVDDKFVIIPKVNVDCDISTICNKTDASSNSSIGVIQRQCNSSDDDAVSYEDVCWINIINSIHDTKNINALHVNANVKQSAGDDYNVKIYNDIVPFIKIFGSTFNLYSEDVEKEESSFTFPVQLFFPSNWQEIYDTFAQTEYQKIEKFFQIAKLNATLSSPIYDETYFLNILPDWFANQFKSFISEKAKRECAFSIFTQKYNLSYYNLESLRERIQTYIQNKLIPSLLEIKSAENTDSPTKTNSYNLPEEFRNEFLDISKHYVSLLCDLNITEEQTDNIYDKFFIEQKTRLQQQLQDLENTQAFATTEEINSIQTQIQLLRGIVYGFQVRKSDFTDTNFPLVDDVRYRYSYYTDRDSYTGELTLRASNNKEFFISTEKPTSVNDKPATKPNAKYSFSTKQDKDQEFFTNDTPPKVKQNFYCTSYTDKELFVTTVTTSEPTDQPYLCTAKKLDQDQLQTAAPEDDLKSLCSDMSVMSDTNLDITQPYNKYAWADAFYWYVWLEGPFTDVIDAKLQYSTYAQDVCYVSDLFSAFEENNFTIESEMECTSKILLIPKDFNLYSPQLITQKLKIDMLEDDLYIVTRQESQSQTLTGNTEYNKSNYNAVIRTVIPQNDNSLQINLQSKVSYYFYCVNGSSQTPIAHFKDKIFSYKNLSSFRDMYVNFETTSGERNIDIGYGPVLDFNYFDFQTSYEGKTKPDAILRPMSSDIADSGFKQYWLSPYDVLRDMINLQGSVFQNNVQKQLKNITEQRQQVINNFYLNFEPFIYEQTYNNGEEIDGFNLLQQALIYMQTNCFPQTTITNTDIIAMNGLEYNSKAIVRPGYKLQIFNPYGNNSIPYLPYLSTIHDLTDMQELHTIKEQLISKFIQINGSIWKNNLTEDEQFFYVLNKILYDESLISSISSVLRQPKQTSLTLDEMPIYKDILTSIIKSTN